MQFKRAGQWIPCSIVGEFQVGYIISYIWQGISYQCRAASELVRKGM